MMTLRVRIYGNCMTWKNSHMKALFIKRFELLLCLFLVVAVISVYGQVRHFEFTMYDDGVYVYENCYIQDGLTVKNIIWALTSAYAANWHPLTWMSHMLDISLYGMEPGGHHLTNVLLHTINALLLFYLFNQMTGNLRPSLFVACLFALHPLHVESVAWIAERKDVLSAFWGLLAILSYGHYVRQLKAKWYLLALSFFCASLMSKPTLVTLPFMLLLLDYWPLGRFKFLPLNSKSAFYFELNLRLILEKLPFIILSAGSCIVTLFVQKSGGAVASLELFTIDSRIANALVSYTRYIGKMLWPSELAVIYPYQSKIPLWQIIGSSILLAVISFMICRYGRRHSYLIVGWFWYLGSLVPVIGLVQVGSQAMADRYTYLPLIGLFVIIAWGIPELSVHLPCRKVLLFALAVASVSILMLSTWMQLRYWENDIKLFQHAVNVTSDNYAAHNNLGLAMYHQGKSDEAYHHYSKALQIYPGYALAHNNMGFLLAKQEKIDDAIRYYSNAIHLNPNFEKAHANLAVVLSEKNLIIEATNHYKTAVRINPNYSEAHLNLGIMLAGQGMVKEASKHLNTVLEINGGYEAQAHYNLGNILRIKEGVDDAIYHYLEALRIKPDFGKAHNNLGIAFIQKGMIDNAVINFKKALQINPNAEDAYNNLKKALAITKKD